MYDDHGFQPGREEPNPSGLASSSLAVGEPLLLAKPAQPAVQLSNTTLILVPLSLLALWAIAVLWFSQHTKRHITVRQKEDGRKLFKRVPCRQCRFFKDNPYLKCAIRPSDALTAQAIDCADYASHADRQRRQ
ncbi:MAG: hypothetical protein KME45_10105 [Stenomitos rutilans HA7619-LM2]|jgi:hypothetical protein|nr:hypothetical protein [Stenomitos rutilans HA7619-LM2]